MTTSPTNRVASLFGTACLLCLSQPASAAVLTLLDWTTVPVPAGAHPDLYPLPAELIGTAANPVVTVEIDHRNLPNVAGMGVHEIQSAAFLFKATDLVNFTIIENTSERFWARVQFAGARRMTGLADNFAPAFVAMHGTPFPAGVPKGGADTSANWTVTYLNGSTASANDGIIPEPGTSTCLALSAGLILFLRRKTRPGAAN